MNNFSKIQIWRMSASRPWQVEKTHPALINHLKYSGELEYHLIESVLVEELSNECIKFGNRNGYTVHVINPAEGQGMSMDYALTKVIDVEYSLKWEDDFMPV